MTLNMEQGARSGAPLNHTRSKSRVLLRTSQRIDAYSAEIDHDDEGAVLCPAAGCGFGYAHTERSILPYMTSKDDTPSGWSIRVRGECDHEYTLVIREYKGRLQILAIPESDIL